MGSSYFITNSGFNKKVECFSPFEEQEISSKLFTKLKNIWGGENKSISQSGKRNEQSEDYSNGEIHRTKNDLYELFKQEEKKGETE